MKPSSVAECKICADSSPLNISFKRLVNARTNSQIARSSNKRAKYFREILVNAVLKAS